MRQVMLLLSFVLILSPFSFSQEHSVNEFIQMGDAASASFDNKKALEYFTAAEKQDPQNWEILWRISRAYVDIAEHMPSNTDDQKDEQLAVYEKSLNYAEKAVRQAPNQSITYVRRAISNGKIALFKGVFSVSGVVNKVRDDCETAIKIGSGGEYVQALAHYVLGRTHSKVSEKWAPARAVLGLGWADEETGIKELKKATELYPNFRMFYLDLAKAYIEADEYAKAKTALTKLMNSPVKDEDDGNILIEAKDLLNKIKDE